MNGYILILLAVSTVLIAPAGADGIIITGPPCANEIAIVVIYGKR
jgi:hypothetical protein